MTKSLFYASLTLIFLLLFNEYNNYIFLFFYVFCCICTCRYNKKIFILINIISIFEILYSFKPILNIGEYGAIKELLLGRIKDENVKSYISLVLFNDKNNNIYDVSLNLSISYLIVISGLHINLLHKVVSSILSKIIYAKISEILSICFISLYLIIIGIPISSLRAFLTLFLSIVVSKLNKFDKYFLVVIIVYILNPKSIFTLSYIYSFLLTFMIIYINDNLPNSKLLQSLLISTLSFFISVPINIKYNGAINLFSIIYSLLFTYPFLISLILSFIVLLFPFLSFILKWFVICLEKIMMLFSKTVIHLYIRELTIVEYIFYYISIMVLIILINRLSKNVWKSFIMMLFCIICLYFSSPKESLYEVIFVNVYQGDCIIFKCKYSNVGYMVDTGGNRTYDIAENILLPLLDNMKIDVIDKIVITHEDYDHCVAL